MAPAPPLSLSHRLWRRLPAGPRRRLFAEVTARLAPQPARGSPPVTDGLVVAGEFSRASGLGEGARLMHRALQALDVPSYPLDVSTLLSRRTPGETVAAPAEGSPVAWRTTTGAGVVLHVNPPVLPWVLLKQKRRWLRGRRVIGYWSWDLETLPATWRPGARLVHEVWVPSHFVAQAIERLIPGRVRVVPHALAVSPPVCAPLERAAFGLPEGTIIVLVSFNLASSFARKNPLAAVNAFRAAFGDRPDRLLLMKVGNAEREPDDFAKITSALADQPNARIMTEMLPPGDNYALMRASDVVLNLHRSEGFGLVPAEAMLLGKPVIATGWSGNLDFMDPECAALVPYRLVPARDPRGVFEAPGAVWAEADVGAAARRLVALADNAEARAALGARAKLAATARLGTGPLEAALAALHLPAHPRAGAQG